MFGKEPELLSQAFHAASAKFSNEECKFELEEVISETSLTLYNCFYLSEVRK